MQTGTPFKSTSCENKGSNALDAPAFSRPAQMEAGISSVGGIRSAVQGCRYTDPTPEAPMFARPSAKPGKPQFHSEEMKHKGELRTCLNSFLEMNSDLILLH